MFVGHTNKQKQLIERKKYIYRRTYMQAKRYEKPRLTMSLFYEEDVLTSSGYGEIKDSYGDGWENPFIDAEVYND